MVKVALLSILVVLAAVQPGSEAVTKLTHAQAFSKIKSAGISISSSGGCSDRYNPRCTSLEQVNKCTVDQAIIFKKACKCSLTITGGTEVGHSVGIKSHANGYKLDFRLDTTLSSYITRTYTYKGTRPGDGAKHYRSPQGNDYYLEGNHWDVAYC